MYSKEILSSISTFRSNPLPFRDFQHCPTPRDYSCQCLGRGESSTVHGSGPLLGPFRLDLRHVEVRRVPFITPLAFQSHSTVPTVEDVAASGFHMISRTTGGKGGRERGRGSHKQLTYFLLHRHRQGHWP